MAPVQCSGCGQLIRCGEYVTVVNPKPDKNTKRSDHVPHSKGYHDRCLRLLEQLGLKL